MLFSGKRRFSSTGELWATVGRIRDELREAHQDEAAQRLHDAMTISAHPGEVWPGTLAVIRELLHEHPPGLDEEAARACAYELSRWP